MLHGLCLACILALPKSRGVVQTAVAAVAFGPILFQRYTKYAKAGYAIYAASAPKVCTGSGVECWRFAYVLHFVRSFRLDEVVAEKRQLFR